MKSGRQIFALKNNFDALAAGILGYYLIYLFTRHSGLGISPDSVIYLSVERNLSHAIGFVQFDGSPLVDFPGGYSIFLWLISSVSRLDPLIYGPVLNGLLFGFLIYASGALMNGFSHFSRRYKAIVLSIVVFSPCLLEIYPMLWSETLFIVLLILFMYFIARYFHTHELRLLLLASGFAALACITRYAGVTLIVTGCGLIILDYTFNARQRWKHLLLFALMSSSLLTINLVRNRMVAGFSTGMRQHGITPLLDNCYYFGSVLCEWLPLPKEHRLLSLLVAFLAILLMILFLIRTISIRPVHFSYEDVAVAFGLFYSLFIILSATISRYQQLNSRLLSPLFIPFIWTISFRIPMIGKKVAGFWRWIFVAVILVLVLGFQYAQLAADYETWDGVRDAGVPGYTEDPFPQSQIVDYIKKNASQIEKGYRIYSNAADAYYFFTERRAHLLPELAFPLQVGRFYLEKHFYLVWFNDVENPDEPTIRDILQHRAMIPVAQFPDGSVWISKDPSQ